MKTFHQSIFQIVVTILTAVSFNTAQAQVDSFWNPSGSNTLFSNSANWSNGVPDINDDAHFGAGFPFTVTMNVQANVGSFNHSIGNMALEGGNGLKIASDTAINSILKISGVGTQFIETSDLNIGTVELGRITISDGGLLEVADILRLAATAGIDGEIIVSGAGSTLEADQLRVGQAGNADITVEDGAAVFANRSRIGFGTQSDGMATLTGIGSRWENTASVNLGHFGGSGMLNISGGGRFTSETQINIGFAPDSTGVVSMSGSSSYLEADEMFVGMEGDGELNMISGSDALVSNFIVVGDANSATGTLNVSSLAQLTTGTIAVADEGNGALNISSNGAVDCNGIIVGNAAGTFGSIDVDNASLDCSSLLMGGNGSGNLIIENAGEVTVSGLTFVNSGFDIIFQDPGLNDSAGTLNANGGLSIFGDVLFFSGGGEINGDVAINGDGELRVGSIAGAVGTINGDLTNNGSRTLVVANTTLNVIGQATGASPFEGPGDVNLIGGVSPGNGTGFLEFECDVDLFVNSEIDIEIGGSSPGSQHDQLQFASNLLLRGNLNIIPINSFQPIPGQQFMIMQIDGIRTGALNGLSQNSVVTSIGNTNLEIDYFGGDGNDIVLHAVDAETLLGDVNQDGFVNLLDVAPFVDLLANGNFQAEADCNEDGVVDLLDVQPFVDLLSN